MSAVYHVAHWPQTPRARLDWEHPAWSAVDPIELVHYMGDRPAHRPQVQVRLAYDDEAVHGIFRVADRYVRAVARQYQDSVCCDSCVEFFFTPGPACGHDYFNLEMNCGGTKLFRWNPAGADFVPVAADDGEQVEVVSTLPRRVDPEIREPVTWTLAFRLPLAVVRRYAATAAPPAPGVTWRANVYKCGDETSHPHWLTWAKVEYPEPKFHLPAYFGTLTF